jgi:hypothetical protein
VCVCVCAVLLTSNYMMWYVACRLRVI